MSLFDCRRRRLAASVAVCRYCSLLCLLVFGATASAAATALSLSPVGCYACRRRRRRYRKLSRAHSLDQSGRRKCSKATLAAPSVFAIKAAALEAGAEAEACRRAKLRHQHTTNEFVGTSAETRKGKHIAGQKTCCCLSIKLLLHTGSGGSDSSQLFIIISISQPINSRSGDWRKCAAAQLARPLA